MKIISIHIITIIFIFGLLNCGKTVDKIVPIASVKQGDFYIQVVESGEVKATHAINLSSPALSWRFGQMKITKIIEDGQEIKAGDTVIRFDPSEVEKAKIDAEAKLEIAKAELEKMKAQHDSKISELESNLKIAQIDYEISSIVLEQATYEAEVTRKEIQLKLDQSKISLEKANEEIENQKKIHKETQFQQILKIKQFQADVDESEKSLQSLTVVSPSDGIAIIRENRQTGNKWQIGDETWSGNPIIDLPDLKELKVIVEINEVDISKIKLRQQTEIQLDAFSDTCYSGQVNYIAALAKYKKKDSKIKIFPVDILMKGSPKNLMPGMTVSCKILVDKVENVVYIPLEALHTIKDEEFVYVKSGNSFSKKIIHTGQSNNDFVIVAKGLEKDEIIALAEPFEDEQGNIASKD